MDYQPTFPVVIDRLLSRMNTPAYRRINDEEKSFISLILELSVLENLAINGSSEVEQMTHNPKFEGLNPATAGSGTGCSR
jgi:hypothetical protein